MTKTCRCNAEMQRWNIDDELIELYHCYKCGRLYQISYCPSHSEDDFDDVWITPETIGELETAKKDIIELTKMASRLADDLDWLEGD